jgi:hypothetical protein
MSPSNIYMYLLSGTEIIPSKASQVARVNGLANIAERWAFFSSDGGYEFGRLILEERHPAAQKRRPHRQSPRCLRAVPWKGSKTIGSSTTSSLTALQCIVLLRGGFVIAREPINNGFILARLIRGFNYPIIDRKVSD